jgi:hypothetical protein
MSISVLDTIMGSSMEAGYAGKVSRLLRLDEQSVRACESRSASNVDQRRVSNRAPRCGAYDAKRLSSLGDLQ